MNTDFTQLKLQRIVRKLEHKFSQSNSRLEILYSKIKSAKRYYQNKINVSSHGLFHVANVVLHSYLFYKSSLHD